MIQLYPFKLPKATDKIACFKSNLWRERVTKSQLSKLKN